MKFSAIAAAALSTLTVAKAANLTSNAQDLFDFAMSVNDVRFDASYGYIWYLDNGPWSTRFTAWYIPGLLHRNQGDDLKNAELALKNLINVQMNYNYTSYWYGDFKLAPDEPNPSYDSTLYPPQIYGTYDPNWREFIGSQLVQIVEEFEDILDPELVSGIETALAYDAVGAMRRNGTNADGDNLILAYSNPQYMRTLVVGWIGARLNNQTFIDFANTKGTELFELFTANGTNTLGEYNCPNYYAEDVWGIAANIKYGPKNATMTTNAKYILTELWKDIADHYNPYLGNIAGPYDRAYARDMPTHSAIVGQFWWGLFGYEKAPLPWKGNDDFHYDVAQGAAFALIMDTVASHISNATMAKLITPFEGERFLNKTIRTSLDNDVTRTAVSWMSKTHMIGGQQVAETVNRGQQFVPAIVHWASDPSHTPFPYGAWFSLYPTASTIDAIVGPNTLDISYPNTTQAGTDTFVFMLSGIPPTWTLAGNTIAGFSTLPCLSLNVSAPGLQEVGTTYYGNTIYNHYFYNITYVVPSNFTGTPRISFEMEYTC
ncbi:hypothetical protein BP6252_02364 [Coleophoma cylindrospora]|uniref:Uncharacterized protein n=1 Tax=Coleophoma cylindrospora TaxID=1849047 RepID=A0A3D8SF77_9HELO|nr:hypothetical protein BP6252_02364 [Coleophoma cylindrospora]